MDRPPHRHPRRATGSAATGRWRDAGRARLRGRARRRRAARADEVDQVIVSTITPDRVTPGLAPEVARLIGAARRRRVRPQRRLRRVPLRAGPGRRAGRVRPRARRPGLRRRGAQPRSPTHDDRGTAVLFGDGAGAVVVAAGELDRGCRRLRPGLRRRAGRAALRRQRRPHAAHGGPRGLPPRGRADGRGDAGGRRRRRPDAVATSTCSSPTRPTRGSSRPRPPSSACRARRSCSTSTASPTRRAPRSRSRWPTPSATGCLRPGATVGLAAFGARLRLGRGRRLLEGARACLRLRETRRSRWSPAARAASARRSPSGSRPTASRSRRWGAAAATSRPTSPIPTPVQAAFDAGARALRPGARARQQRRRHARRPGDPDAAEDWASGHRHQPDRRLPLHASAALEDMLKARWGRIVNVSLVVAERANPGQANYVAAKAGLLGFTRTVAQARWASARASPANAVTPGVIDDRHDRRAAQGRDSRRTCPPAASAGPRRSRPPSRSSSPTDAAYVNGATLAVDGAPGRMTIPFHQEQEQRRTPPPWPASRRSSRRSATSSPRSRSPTPRGDSRDDVGAISTSTRSTSSSWSRRSRTASTSRSPTTRLKGIASVGDAIALVERLQGAAA